MFYAPQVQLSQSAAHSVGMSSSCCSPAGMALLQGPGGSGGGGDPPPWRKALPEIDWKGDYEEEGEEELDLRFCKRCKRVSYLRKGACCNPKCVTLLACQEASHCTGGFLTSYLAQ